MDNPDNLADAFKAFLETRQEPAAPTPGAPPPPAPPTPAPAPDASEPVEEAPAELSADWPQKGYTGPQPWQVTGPITLSHGQGFLIPGSAGAEVETLARLLAYAGYPTSSSRGENPLGIFGESEREAANAFRTAYGIEEDPAVIAASVPEVVGPWTWEALYRIAVRKAA
jgi:hypothetical protein